MRNNISEADFKIALQRNEKKNDKSNEIRNVLDILFSTITEIMYRFRAHLHAALPNQWTLDILEEVDPIVDYANECLADIAHTYGSKRMRFLNDLRQK
jgi:hypothetical protein